MAEKGFITGKGLLKRILLTLALACAFLLFLAAVDAYAAPIRPDIRKIVTEATQDTSADSIPARAGWDGPEMPLRTGVVLLPAGEGLARADRAELIAAATPDPRAVLGIGAVIFLLRMLKKQEEKRAKQFPASGFQFPEQKDESAAQGEQGMAA